MRKIKELSNSASPSILDLPLLCCGLFEMDGTAIFSGLDRHPGSGVFGKKRYQAGSTGFEEDVYKYKGKMKEERSGDAIMNDLMWEIAVP